MGAVLNAWNFQEASRKLRQPLAQLVNCDRTCHRLAASAAATDSSRQPQRRHEAAAADSSKRHDATSVTTDQ